MTSMVSGSGLLHDAVTPAEREIYQQVQSCTMTSAERVIAAIRSVDHVVEKGIAGGIVECGVWRGGSMMAMALALLRHGDVGRTLFLYDTFAGMSAPGDRDVQFDGAPASAVLAASSRDSYMWAVASLDQVRSNLASTGYPIEGMRFIAGPVEETIPRILPDAIAILRLDTDWYASTRHELAHLYPLLSDGGILIVDDYGHWRGAKEATDEYFSQSDDPPVLHRIDYTGVLALKNWR
jgi:O-methyltransferase